MCNIGLVNVLIFCVFFDIVGLLLGKFNVLFVCNKVDKNKYLYYKKVYWLILFIRFDLKFRFDCLVMNVVMWLIN